MVKVSVIVPVYNAKSYLDICLESLLGQTLYDIEIVVVDDASTDGSRELLKMYEQRDARIQLIFNDENIGAAESRNVGIAAARGEYLQFVDADDYLELDALDYLYQISNQNNAEMCYLGMYFHQEKDMDETTVQSSIIGNYPSLYSGKELIYRFTENKEFFLYLCSVFYRRAFIQEKKLIFKNLTIGEGGDFILRALCNAKKVLVCAKKHYHYRLHGNSAMHSINVKKELLIGQIVQYIDVLRYFSEDEEAMELRLFLEGHYKKIIGGIRNLSRTEQKEIETRLETDFEKHIFYILQQKSALYGIKFDEKVLGRVQAKKFVIIYGAGYASQEVIERLQEYNIEIIGFAVTQRKAEQTALYGHHIYEIDELIQYNKESIVLVAANRKYNYEIQKALKDYGFNDYIFLNVEI